MMNRQMNEEMLKSAVRTINHWYDLLGKAIDENNDKLANEYGTNYENAIEYYAPRVGCSEAKLEDIATDVRYLGWDYD